MNLFLNIDTIVSLGFLPSSTLPELVAAFCISVCSCMYIAKYLQTSQNFQNLENGNFYKSQFSVQMYPDWV